MAYSKQTWDTTSYVNPTRMNHIEQGIYDVDNKGWTQITVPTPTQSGNEYTYAISNLSNYKFACIKIGISGYGAGSDETVAIQNSQYFRDYKDDNGYEWAYRISISKTNNTIKVLNIAGSFPAEQFMKNLDALYVM